MRFLLFAAAVAFAACSSDTSGHTDAHDAAPGDTRDVGALDVPNDISFDVALDVPFDVGIDAPPDIRPDVIEELPPEDAPGTHEYVYVIDQVAIEPDSMSAPHNGFNVDGLFSAIDDSDGCFHQDYLALYDDDQNCTAVASAGGTCTGLMDCASTAAGCLGGVDNQLPTLATTISAIMPTQDLRTTISNEVASSQFVLLVRVSNISDPTDMNAAGVRVRIYTGFATFDTDCTEVTPGRTYAVSTASLVPGATSVDQALYDFPGSSIVDGRLVLNTSVGADTFDLTIPLLPGTTVGVTVHGFDARGDISATDFTDGTLGGWVSGNDVAADLTSALPMYASLIGPIIGGMVDVKQSTVGMGGCSDTVVTPHQYGGIGLGLGIHGVPAILAPTPAFSAAPGVCGSM